jgi:putative transposase
MAMVLTSSMLRLIGTLARHTTLKRSWSGSKNNVSATACGYTRMIVGWSMDARMTRELVTNALRMARFRRKPMAGVLHHSDRGSQYCSHDYQALLAQYGMVASMSRKGNCWDNAPMESFFNSLKNERVFHEDYATRAEAKQDLFEYIESFYNRNRRHSGLNYRSPAQQYAAWIAGKKLAA